MRSLLMTKKRLDGNIFTEMFSDFQSTSLCFQLLLVLELSSLLCKIPRSKFLMLVPVNTLVSSNTFVSLPVQFSSSSLHLSAFSIHTTEVLYSQPLLLYMLWLLVSLVTQLAPFICSSKGQTGWEVAYACILSISVCCFMVDSLASLWFQVRNLLLTSCLFCGPLFLTFCFLNTVAIIYNATAALPFGTILVILLIWTLVTSPLLVLGGIAGKNSKSEFQAPCRTTKHPREIPELAWYRGTIPQMAMAGFLPFSAIYVELYYIFASVWGHRIYTIYSILFIVFIILIIVTAFITIALTYFQLAAEDHQWWWR